MGVIRELAVGHGGERRWQVIISGPRRDDGVYARITKVVTGSKREARQTMAELELDLAKRPAKRENNIAVLAVGTVLERWLEHAEQFEGRSPSTLREYRRLVAVELIPAVGAFKIEDLAVRHLENLYRKLMTRGLAPASVRRVHVIVRRALSQAVKWELVERNVALNASQPQETQREQHPPSVEVVREVIEEATRQDTHGVGLLVRLAAATGARRGELVALRWRHVNLDAKSVLIESSLPRAQPRPAVV